jgi:hypothetical protein
MPVYTYACGPSIRTCDQYQYQHPISIRMPPALTAFASTGSYHPFPGPTIPTGAVLSCPTYLGLSSSPGPLTPTTAPLSSGVTTYPANHVSITSLPCAYAQPLSPCAFAQANDSINVFSTQTSHPVQMHRLCKCTGYLCKCTTIPIYQYSI